MIPKRSLGKTDEQLSIVGFGGILVQDTAPQEAQSLVAMAVDRGVNYFDVAPSYGNAEECLGPAIQPYRDRIFLACKTGKRTRDEARRELETSLRRLRTDHFDLYQMHGMTTHDDVDQALGPNGALETMVRARDEGLVRYLGFSTHSVDVALRLLEAFAFDSVMLPINWVAVLKGNFGLQVLEMAANKGVGRLALKAMARQRYPQGAERKYERCWYEPIDNKADAELALRFTLSQDITAAIPPGEPKFFPWALDVAEDFEPVSTAEVEELRAKASELTPVFVHPAH